MAFPNLGAQQETNRKILEDLQIKKQLLQKGVASVTSNLTVVTPVGTVGTTAITPSTAAATSVPTDGGNNIVSGSSGIVSSIPATIPAIISTSGLTQPINQRSNFNINSSTTLGFFVSTDSFFGNTYIPVLPRLEPPPPPPTSTVAAPSPSPAVTAK